MRNFESAEGGNTQKELAMQYLALHKESTSMLNNINIVGNNLQKMRGDGLDRGFFADQYKNTQTEYNELNAEFERVRDQMEDLKEKMTDETRDTYLTIKVDNEGRQVMFRPDGSQEVA